MTAELAALPDPQARAAVDQAVQEGWLRNTQVGAHELVKVLSVTLHAGESEAIALGVQLRAGMVLIDEREARRAAGLLDLRVTGVLGILLRAKRDGAVNSLSDEVGALRVKARFFVAAGLERQVLSEAGE